MPSSSDNWILKPVTLQFNLSYFILYKANFNLKGEFNL